MNYMTFEELCRKALEIDMSVKHLGDDKYKLESSDGRSILACPACREKVEGFLRWRIKAHDEAQR